MRVGEPLHAVVLEAEHHLAAALGKARVLHEPGQREAQRALLALAIERAEAALAAAELPALALARSILAQAHAARAEDALHGAGQLSQSAQRAPTRDACDDGWQRVEAIVLGAEHSAREAATAAAELAASAPASAVARKAQPAARRAEAAALAARRIVEQRNHAYTFHTDDGFSFGEGWYLAAAAVLAGVAIQIEPGERGSEQAETFLRDAGLAHRIQPYRSRPRAMKQTTELVARAFRADPSAARAKLRAAFLGPAPMPDAVSVWADQRLHAAYAGAAAHGDATSQGDATSHEAARARNKVLIWIRDGVHHAGRNSTSDEIGELAARARRAGLVPVLIGDALPVARLPEGALDLILFWKDATFRGPDRRRAQLRFFEYLRERHGLVGQLGVTTAGMDGPALMGLPTLYLTEKPNPRMREWVGAVPGYVEVVREPDYLERVTRVLGAWALA